MRHTLRRRATLAGCFTACAVLAGCGSARPAVQSSTSSGASSAASVPADLAGNWLLYGAIPKAVSSNLDPPGLAVSMDVVGSSIVAGAAIETTCASGGGFGGNYSAALTGTVAADGSFTVALPAQSGSTTLSISGVVPATAGGAWPGTYHLTAALPAFNGTSCTIDQSGAFTATPMQDVTGTYTGTGSVPFASAGVPAGTPLVITLSVQQGAPLYGPGGVLLAASSRLALAGSVQIQGLPCFSKGKTGTAIESAVEGGLLHLSFLMDDGSTLIVSGGVDDPNAKELEIDIFNVAGGACNGALLFSPFHPLVLQRQGP